MKRIEQGNEGKGTACWLGGGERKFFLKGREEKEEVMKNTKGRMGNKKKNSE